MHALITGASTGIGEALVLELARAGYDITLVARRADELARVAGSIEGERRSHVIAADLSDPKRAESVFSEAEAALGPVDVLVNNAGIQIVAQTIDVDVEDGERLLRLNVLTPFRLTAAALRSMVPRKSGTIVDISSLAALAPTPGMYHYSASKAALAAASETLRAELRHTGVHVVTVYPGPVATALAERALARYDKDPLMGLPVGRADKLAKLITKAIRKKQGRVIYPKAYVSADLFPGITRFVMGRMSPLPKRKG